MKALISAILLTFIAAPFSSACAQEIKLLCSIEKTKKQTSDIGAADPPPTSHRTDIDVVVTAFRNSITIQTSDDDFLSVSNSRASGVEITDLSDNNKWDIQNIRTEPLPQGRSGAYKSERTITIDRNSGGIRGSLVQIVILDGRMMMTEYRGQGRCAKVDATKRKF